MPTAPLLEVRGLSIALPGGLLLSNAAFEVPAGAVVGLTGDSGCGKTTLALALLKLLPKRYTVQGSVRLRERELLTLSERQLESVRGAQVSLVFQDPLQALNPVMRVRHQISEVIRAHRRNENPDCLLELVELPPTDHIRDAYPHQLSGGERQRVCLAMALAASPSLVIADEPFSALDAPRVAELLKLFRSLKQKLETSFLLIGHSRTVLAEIADRVMVMRDGLLDGS